MAPSFQILSATVMKRLRVHPGSTVTLTIDYPGADGSNTIVPSGTQFKVDGIRRAFYQDGSKVYLFGKWGDKRIRVPALGCNKVS